MSVLARIAGALGLSSRAAARLPAAERGRVIPDLPLWNQSHRIGGGLTPRDVSNIIRQADGGVMYRLMDLANESRQKDCHLQAVLSVSEESIAGLKWRIAVPDGARSKDTRAAKWVEEVLRGSPHLPRLIGHIAGAVYYSYAVSEIIWEKVDGRFVPASFSHLAPRRFGYRLEDGAFVLRDQGTDNDGIDFMVDYPNKFITSHPRVTGDVPQREGLLRVLIWAALFRNWAFADWLRTAETTWKPWRIGTYQKNASKEDISNLEAILVGLTTSGTATIAETTKLAIEWPQGTQSSKATHAELVNVLAQEVSKAVLGQTETVQSSAGSGYAQAKVHDAVRKDLRESRARQVAADITRDLIKPMIDLNFSGIECPRFEFMTDDSVDMVAFADAIGGLAGHGLKVPQGWIRDQLGIPEPDPKDDVIGLLLAPPVPADGTTPSDGTTPANANDGNPAEPPPA